MSNWRATVLPILFGLSVTSLGATFLYLLFKKDEDHEDFPAISLNKVKREIQIPKNCINSVVGRSGNKISEIQAQTQTKISFYEPENSDVKICVIKGDEEACTRAEELIHQAINKQSLVQSFELWIPKMACGRIIGKSGEQLRLISRNSGARITIDSLCGINDHSQEHRVVLKGTGDEIEIAKNLIEQIVKEDEEIRKKLMANLANRSPRKEWSPPILSITETGEREQNAASVAATSVGDSEEKLIPSGSNGFLEVYISAVESPSKFWLQMISPAAVELDHLNEQMNTYYESEDNRKIHLIDELRVGQIVAAPFHVDKKWYRARIMELDSDEYNSCVKLYFVDYGDSDECTKENLMELRTDFLRLPHQAVECSLAKIVPSNGIEWSDDATDLFEKLCHVALWKVLMAKVHSYKRKDKGNMIPLIDLYDTSNKEDIYVNKELINQGFGEWETLTEEKDDEKESITPVRERERNTPAL